MRGFQPWIVDTEYSEEHPCATPRSNPLTDKAREMLNYWMGHYGSMDQETGKKMLESPGFTINVGKPWVKPGPDQCEMNNPHHPDCECASCRMSADVQCLQPAVGFVPECCDVRVCEHCAAQMRHELFDVTLYEVTQ